MTATYRSLIKRTLMTAINSTKEANHLLSESQANYHVLQAAAVQLHQAARAADRALGMIEAHRIIEDERHKGD